MGVTIPGFHLRSEHDLEELRYRLKGTGRHRQLHQELTLTSMIDMFAVIIIFLIQTFSATGEFLFVNKDITLPSAQHGQLLERAPIVTVMADKVILEGAGVGDNTDAEDLIEEKDWELPQLKAKLKEYKRFWESTHEGVEFPAEVVIQADKQLEFIYLKRVLFTLVQLEFSSINLATRGDVDSSIYNTDKALPAEDP